MIDRIKIWIDDLRCPPNEEEWYWCKSVNDFKSAVHAYCSAPSTKIELISLDHDAGKYFFDGGDYIECLNWLEELKYEYLVEPCTTFYLHTGNPVGRDNMRRIIKHCGWKLDEHSEDY